MIFDIAGAVIQEIGALFSSWIIPLLDFMREDYVGAGSVIPAMTRKVPPHRGQMVTSGAQRARPY